MQIKLQQNTTLEQFRNIKHFNDKNKAFNELEDFRNKLARKNNNDIYPQRLQYDYIIWILCGSQNRQNNLVKFFAAGKGGSAERRTLRNFDNLEQLYKDFKKEKNVTISGVFNEILKKTENFEEGTDIKVIIDELRKFLFEKDVIVELRTENKGVDVMSIENRIKSMIDKGILQLILTGPPGTGKTSAALNIAEESDMFEIVQFHPSYDYTDFIEGIRPVEVNEGEEKKLHFKKIDGTFKRFCRDVVRLNKDSNEENKYIFIIDEINRADLSKVLGELMLGFEKRETRIPTQYDNLQTYVYDEKCKSYLPIPLEEDEFADGFYIPENVIIIGTMNDIDRSVESMDFALRRRFMWIDFPVTKSLLKNALANGFFSFVRNKHEIFIGEIVDAVMNVNSVIGKSEYGLNKNYFISQGYFTNLNLELIGANDRMENEQLRNQILKFVWVYRINSLIHEYVRGEIFSEKFEKECAVAFLGEDLYEQIRKEFHYE